jgi:hypothetical protein
MVLCGKGLNFTELSDKNGHIKGILGNFFVILVISRPFWSLFGDVFATN